MLLESFAGTACAFAGAAYAVRGRSSQIFGPSVWHGDRRRPAIALTFDDGPSESTPRILELLHRHRAAATFFQCGANAARLPSIAREISAAGHEIGNHSHTHAGLWLRSPAFIHNELHRAQQTLAAIHGAAPTLFRAPFGVRWFGLRKAQAQLGLLGVMWTTIARDWTLPASSIAARLDAGLANGAILCLHDGRLLSVRPDIGQTIQALEILLPALTAKGYHLKTVSQLLCPTT